LEWKRNGCREEVEKVQGKRKAEEVSKLMVSKYGEDKTG
jgi:hypothetical protein